MAHDTETRTAHTPGPWKVVVGDNGLDGIGRVIVHHHADGLSYRQVATAYAGNEDREANAHLIAAAPDMHAALRKVGPMFAAINDLIGEDEELRARLVAKMIAHGVQDGYADSIAPALAKADGRELYAE